MPVANRDRGGLQTWVKLARPGFWPTHLWFFLLPLGQREMFERWEFWLGCVYVCFPLGALMYGWNDLFDADTDRVNPRKGSFLFGARLDDESLRKVPLFLVLTQLPFAAAFTYAAGSKMLLWLAAMVFANALYNGVGLAAPRSWDENERGVFPGWGWKNWPVLDLANQVAYLLVFVLSSWLLEVPQLALPALVFSALFAMQSHLFGQLMDIDEDRVAGRRTSASYLGVRGGKVMVAAMMGIEAAIAFRWFEGPYVGVFMSLGATWFLVDAIALFGARPYPPWFSRLFFIGWNVVVVGTMYLVWRTGVFLVAPPAT